MKREIKFRGKRVDNGEWVYGTIWICGQGAYILEYRDYSVSMSPIKVIPETVGQFTSLHDKNGNEIYEGDWVGYDNGTKSVVIFKDGCFCEYDGYASSSDEAYTLLLPEQYGPFNEFDFEIEITGNIHDNENTNN